MDIRKPVNVSGTGALTRDDFLQDFQPRVASRHPHQPNAFSQRKMEWC
jgi:hypothetical protein